MGETHHAPVLENWGLLWIYHSIALLVFFGATNWLYLAGVIGSLALRPDLHGRACAAGRRSSGPCGGAADRSGSSSDSSPTSGARASSPSTWSSWSNGCSVCRSFTLAPMIAVTNGMLFMIKAGILSGGYYVQAACTFLAIFPMAAFPRFAPLIFGAVASACFFATGIKYRVRHLRAARPNLTSDRDRL